MQNTNSDIKKNANGLIPELVNKVQDSKNQLGKMVYDTGEKIGTGASDLAHIAMDGVKSSREYVEENPYKGVLYAAGAGLVVGMLITYFMKSSNQGRFRD